MRAPTGLSEGMSMAGSAFTVVLLSCLFAVDLLPSQEWEDPTEEFQKLTASDGEESDLFGGTIAVSGDVIIVGAWKEDDNGEDSGSVYVFRYAPFRGIKAFVCD